LSVSLIYFCRHLYTNIVVIFLVCVGATPDGLVGEDLVVEVKCPYSAFNMSAEEAIQTKKITFWKYDPITKEYSVNFNCPWYFQIQGQLEVTNRKGCIFGVWTGLNQPIKTEYILRRRDFWEHKMKYQLETFYFKCMLPELVDPRQSRSMPISEPKYVTEAQENKK